MWDAVWKVLQPFWWQESEVVAVGNWQVLCEYVPDDECEPTYVWYQGKVVKLVMQTDTEAVVKIEWNKTCMQHGDPKVTKHVLKKSKWNLTAKDAWKTNGVWRQDLLHLIK
jgi:hypothetical protein